MKARISVTGDLKEFAVALEGARKAVDKESLLQALEAFSRTGVLTLRDQILHTKSISKELDYSEENLDSFCDQSWKSPSLSCEGFCSMISLLLG